MCMLCGPASAAGEFGITLRPAGRLRGLSWTGTPDDATAGALRDLHERVRDCATGFWSGPVVSIGWQGDDGRLRCFAGLAAGEGGPALSEDLALPEMRFATAWHHASDGEVIARYGRMVDWIEAHGHARDVSVFHQREEYPLDSDFRAVSALRLMLPVA